MCARVWLHDSTNHPVNSSIVRSSFISRKATQRWNCCCLAIQVVACTRLRMPRRHNPKVRSLMRLHDLNTEQSDTTRGRALLRPGYPALYSKITKTSSTSVGFDSVANVQGPGVPCAIKLTWEST